MTVLSILVIWGTVASGKHHKKKNQGIFGSVTSLYEDFVPKISHHLLKFAVDRLSDHEEEEEHDLGGHFFGNLISGIGGGNGGGKQKHHHHHHQKGQKGVVYKPVYVGNDYGSYDNFYHTPSYGGPYQNYEPIHNNFHADFSSGLNNFNHFDDYNFQHYK